MSRPYRALVAVVCAALSLLSACGGAGCQAGERICDDLPNELPVISFDKGIDDSLYRSEYVFLHSDRGHVRAWFEREFDTEFRTASQTGLSSILDWVAITAGPETAALPDLEAIYIGPASAFCESLAQRIDAVACPAGLAGSDTVVNLVFRS